MILVVGAINLITADFDAGVRVLKNWAGTGGQTIISGNTRNYYGFNNNGVYVYYYINRTHSQGNLDIRDIDFALKNMDSTCSPYVDGFYLWDGTPELVGKCRSGTAVCIG